MPPLTRFLAVDLKELPIEHLLFCTGSILLLTLAVLVLRLADSKFATSRKPEAVSRKRRLTFQMHPGVAVVIALQSS